MRRIDMAAAPSRSPSARAVSAIRDGDSVRGGIPAVYGVDIRTPVVYGVDMESFAVGRVVAAILSLATFAFLFRHDSWRADNQFLVPDLLLCAGLAVAAVAPGRHARRWLPVAFAFAAGVLAVSVASYAVRDELGTPSLAGAVVALGFAALLARPLGEDPAASRATRPQERSVKPAASS